MTQQTPLVVDDDDDGGENGESEVCRMEYYPSTGWPDDLGNWVTPEDAISTRSIQNDYTGCMGRKLVDRACDDILRRSTGMDRCGRLGAFFDLFLRCEKLAGIISDFYSKASGDPKPPFPLPVTYLEKALNYYGLLGVGPGKVTKCHLRDIFQGGPPRGMMPTAKQLRNSFLHSMDSVVRRRIEDNIEYYDDMMSRFLRMKPAPCI